MKIDDFLYEYYFFNGQYLMLVYTLLTIRINQDDQVSHIDVVYDVVGMTDVRVVFILN